MAMEKGLSRPHQRFNQVLKNAGHPHSSQAEKKFNRRLARLYELQSLVQKSIRQSCHQISECANNAQMLICKLWPNPKLSASMSLGSLLLKIKAGIQSTADNRRRAEAEQKQHRLTKWKSQLQHAEVHTVAQWIRKKEQTPLCANVCRNNRVAQTDQEAASLIHSFWQDLWGSQTNRNNQGTADLLAQHSAIDVSWTEPTFWELLAQIRKCHGSAGLDSWHSNEVKHLPEKAIHLFHTLALRWRRTGQVPQALQEGRMTSLLKPGKIQKGEIDTSNLRPITILSVWWRCWAGAWAHGLSMRRFAAQLPDFVSGIHQHLGTEEAATILQDALVNTKGIDYKQAFDRMNANCSAAFLHQIGLPTNITALIHSVWQTQRVVQYGTAIHPQELHSVCTPQGCPLAPITLVCWMISGHNYVQNKMNSLGFDAHSTITGIYMDDRSFVTPSLEQCTARAELWSEWSQQVQLCENLNKIQAVAKTKKMQQQLEDAHPQWTQHNSVKVLGVTITTINRQNSEIEQRRIQTSIARAKLLACLPVARPKVQDLYQSLVIPVAAYGWTCRKAPAETANTLHNALTEALNTTKMANSDIRKVVYAATTHLDIVTLQRLFRRSCRLRWHQKVQWNNSPFTSIHLLRKHMKDHGWQENGPWKWGDPDHLRETITLEATVDTQKLKLFCHQLRTRWRHHCLSNWARGLRHEATLWRQTSTEQQVQQELDQVDLEWVRKTAHTATASQRAVLLGSVVSPTWLHRSMGTSPHCAWCSCTWATLEHI